MNTEQLKTFLSIAETGNFSVSAKKMIVAQSTISKRIRELEKEVGQALFERGRAGASLTMAGKSLLEYAGRILSMEEKAIEQINRTHSFKGHLVLGTVYAYFDVYLKWLLARFLEEHPDISVQVVFGHTSRILSECLEGRADVGFTHHPYSHPEYQCELAEEDDVVLVTGEANTEWRDGISVEAVKRLPLIASNFLYASTHDWLFPRDQQFQLELDIAGHALPFLKQGKWYTMLARKMVERELATGELLEIPIRNRSEERRVGKEC